MNSTTIPIPMHTLNSGLIGVGAIDSNSVPDAFLLELMLKQLFRMGELKLFEVAQRMALGTQRAQSLLEQLRASKLVEVPRRGDVSGDISFAVTDAGCSQARKALEKSQYVGPSPVTLEEYKLQVALQSRRPYPTTVQVLKDAMGDMVIEPSLLPGLGSALNSGKAIYLYGPSGGGKTYLAEHLVKTLQGAIWVPYAIYVDGEAIQVYDPMVHQLIGAPVSMERPLTLDLDTDGRWMHCSRPVVITGCELTLEMLELDFDSVNHRYAAPPQVKANNGIFVVDDLGRQRITARDLLNRWITPLDRRVDYLGLHTGLKFQVPFDVTVIFSSNFTAEELSDPAFSRRLGYKIAVDAMERESYRAVVAQACRRAEVDFDQVSIDFMLDELHPASAQPYLPSVPYDVISKIRDRALYLGEPARLTPALIEWAWNVYFGLSASPPVRPVPIPGLQKAEK